MKLLITTAILVSILSSLYPAQAADDAARKELIGKLKKTYPLETCVVSDEKFGGDMGEPIEYLYEEPGKPARLVRFCCRSCIKSFKKDPAQYLKRLDEAAEKKQTIPPVKTSAYNQKIQGTRKTLHQVFIYSCC